MHFDAARPRPGPRSRSELADLFLTLAAANAAAGRADSAISESFNNLGARAMVTLRNRLA